MQHHFKLNGKYTKLLKAFAQLFGLQHWIKYAQPAYRNGLDLEVDVFIANEWYESILDVFEEGKVGYVSNMREFICGAQEDDVERLSKKILEGTFGERRYIQSMKGGDCVRIRKDGKGFEHVPRFEIRDLPRSLDELMIRLDLAGIDWQKMEIEVGELT